MLALFTRTRTRQNPVFYADRVELRLSHQPERLDALWVDRRSIDLLVWNVFASWDTDTDRAYMAGQLQRVGSERLRAPLSLSLCTGRHRDPTLRPSEDYRRWVTHAHPDVDLDALTAAVEVPVRIESPEVLVLVEATLETVPQGAGGRDRVVELVDTGTEHARAVGKGLVVTTLYRSGSRAARELSAHLARLRDPGRLLAAMPWRAEAPAVELREMSWQVLLRLWEQNREGFQLSRQPVGRFLEHAERLGLR